MDENRQIRFLIPPFFLYASLLWWAYIDPSLHCWLIGLTGDTFREILPILAAAGAATIPLGFSIGTLGVFILKCIFRVLTWGRRGPRQICEASVSEASFASILRRAKAPDDATDGKRPNLLYAVATFDHALLPKGIHEWLRRRFNAFVVAFNSALAIVISGAIALIQRHFCVHLFDPSCGLSEMQWQQRANWNAGQCWWLLANLALFVLFLWAACNSWHETMGMIEFQSRRNAGTKPQRIVAGVRVRPRDRR